MRIEIHHHHADGALARIEQKLDRLLALVRPLDPSQLRALSREIDKAEAASERVADAMERNP